MLVPVDHRRHLPAPDSAVRVLMVVFQEHVVVKSRSLRGCCTIRTATGSLIGADPSVYAIGEAVIHTKPCPYAPALQPSPSTLNTSRLHQPTRYLIHLVHYLPAIICTSLCSHVMAICSVKPSTRHASCRLRNRPMIQDSCSIAIFAMQATT